MPHLFTGLSAFPLTPADRDGVVDTDALGLLVERLVNAGVDSIGIFGSTGAYAYLDRSERIRAVAAALEAAGGRVPLIVGIGALRTSWVVELARSAEITGASGLLLPPMSYTSLTNDEVLELYRTVAASTGLPLCIYNNPGTTNFTFSHSLIAEIAKIDGVAAIKMPPLADSDYARELDILRRSTPDTFRVGYSGDWAATPSLLAGASAWYSVIGGLLPEPALRLTRLAQAGSHLEAIALNEAFSSLWDLFQQHGSLRIMYAIADRLSLPVGDPPQPIQRIDTCRVDLVEAALDRLELPAKTA